MKNAGFGVRLGAHLLDNNIFKLLFIIPFYFISRSASEDVLRAGFSSIMLLIVFVFGVSIGIRTIYNVYFVSIYGGTLGKLAFGLKITSENKLLDKKTAFYRATAGYAFSSVFLYLGFIKILTNKDHSAWHDQLFYTNVTRVANSTAGVMALVALIMLNLILFLTSLSNFVNAEVLAILNNLHM